MSVAVHRLVAALSSALARFPSRHSLRPAVWLTPLLMLGTLVASQPAAAHPHGWVDLRVTLRLDDQGRAVAMRQYWLLDPFYSLTLRQELAALEDDTSMEQRLDVLGSEILANLSQFDYYTHVTLDGEPVALGKATRQTTWLKGERVAFQMELPLAEPVAMAGHTLSYRIYDPTYYIEILHDPDAIAVQQGLVVSGLEGQDSALSCTPGITPADPDPSKVAEASMLDINATAPMDIGQYFAEVGSVSCEVADEQ